MDNVIENLLKEFKEQRDKIKSMILEVEKLSEQVSNLFPEQIDMRTRKFLEDKVKTTVAFFNVLLDMRKEVSKSIRDEVEVRRRMTEEEFNPDDIESMLDIGGMAKQIEKFKEQKIIRQAKRMKKHKGIKELEEKGIEVPGLDALRDLEEGDN
jgi:hypothetical protein